MCACSGHRTCLKHITVSQVQATADHYATLGVAPRAEAVDIRTAYLALMRRFHPDKNDTPEAIERVHAVNAAFVVLGNVEKRLKYDWQRRRAADAAAEVQRRRRNRLAIASIAAGAALLVTVPTAVVLFSGLKNIPPLAPSSYKVTATTIADDRPVELDPADLVIESRDAVVPPASARIAMVDRSPIESSMAKPRPIADGVPVPRVPISRLAQPLPQRQSLPQLQLQPPPVTKESPIRDRQPAASEPNGSPASANPRCRFVKPGAETAVCNNEALAALDRSVVAFYNQSLKFGAPAKRGALLDSREAFLVRRDGCRSDACLQSVHLAHLQELSAIADGREPAMR